MTVEAEKTDYTPRYTQAAIEAGIDSVLMLDFIRCAEALTQEELRRAMDFINIHTLVGLGYLSPEGALRAGRLSLEREIRTSTTFAPTVVTPLQLLDPPHVAPTFICPSRISQGRSTSAEPQDGWDVLSNGDHTCSWCGSMSPEGFLAMVREAVDPATDTRVERSDKRYKIYIHRPDVRNASLGAIKFYTWHRPPPGDPALVELAENWPKAVASSWSKFCAQHPITAAAMSPPSAST